MNEISEPRSPRPEHAEDDARAIHRGNHIGGIMLAHPRADEITDGGLPRSLGGQDGLYPRHELLVVLIVQFAAQLESDHLRRSGLDGLDHGLCLLQK